MASLRIQKLVPMLVAIAFAYASLLVVTQPADAAGGLFRAKRTWWFSQAGSWTDGQLIPPTGMTPEPPASANVGNTTPNPWFTAPKSFIKNTTYTFMCGPGTFMCYIGYPNSSGWYSYWNAQGSFQKSNPYAPTTTTTVRMRTLMDGYNTALMGWPTVMQTVMTEMGKYSRVVYVATPPLNAAFTIATPTEGGCVVTGVTITKPGDCPGTTQFGGEYYRNRGGSIMIWPGGNRFGGTMRFFGGPNARFYQRITITAPNVTTVTFPPAPTSVQVGTGVPFTIGSVSIAPSSVGYRYRKTNPNHVYRLVVGNTSPGGAPCSSSASPSAAVRPPTNPGCQYYRKTAKYLITRVPYTTGMAQAWQPNGNTNTIQTTTGYDNRTSMGLNGTISMVHPRLVHTYTRNQSVTPSNPVLMTWSSARTRKIDFRFLPEPAGVAMLAAGFATLAGLYRLRRK